MSWLKNIWLLREIVFPAIDILVLTFLIYRGYHILVQTRAIQLVKGAVIIALLYALAFFLNLTTVKWLLNFLVPGLVIGIAIIFQPELRKIFTRIGQGEWFRWSRTNQGYDLEAIITAGELLAQTRRGALIVIGRTVGLKNYLDTGTRMDAEVSSNLLLTIFGHDTPLHDGAVVIEHGRLAAAGCFLPLSEQSDIRSAFGTRHRAALGLAEETDAVVLVVSEERGTLSLAYDGNLHPDLGALEASRRLKQLFQRTSAVREFDRSREAGDDD